MGYRVAVDSPMEAARGADASAANAPTVAGKRNDDSRCDCASQRRPVSQVIGLAYKTRREPLETRRQEGSGRSTITPSLSVLRVRHEADRGRSGAKKLELALLLVAVGVLEQARDHLAQWMNPGDHTRGHHAPELRPEPGHRFHLLAGLGAAAPTCADGMADCESRATDLRAGRSVALAAEARRPRWSAGGL